jgi:hypothetical protein
MAANFIPGDKESRVYQSIFGGQDYLRWHHPGYLGTPGSGAANDPLGGAASQATGLVQGGRLIDTTSLPLLPVGVYFAAFPMNSIQPISVHLLLTWTGGGTITSSIYTTYKDHLTQYNLFTGIGAITSGAEQISTLAAGVGEQWAIVKLTVATATATITGWTRAEYNGQKI